MLYMSLEIKSLLYYIILLSLQSFQLSLAGEKLATLWLRLLLTWSIPLRFSAIALSGWYYQGVRQSAEPAHQK